MPRWLVLLVVLSGFAVRAQVLSSCSVRVDVVLSDKGQPVAGVRVELFERAAGDIPSQVALTNSSGSAQFENLRAGDYHVMVSGAGIETTNGPLFRIDGTHVSESQFIAVRALENDKAGAGNTVNVHELNVPAEASQELARGDGEMKRKHWRQAADHYNKAVTIYPQYTVGYYDLSVAYYQLQQPDEQRDALQKTLNIDDHFVPALVSLAHMEFADHKLPETRALLDRAVAADPADVEALALRVRVDFMEGKYEEAISDAQKVHSLPHTGYAWVHYTAAAAYQQLNRIPEMINELKTYLKEDPTSSNASYVRQTIVAEGGTPD
jgi:hypothetical protein